MNNKLPSKFVLSSVALSWHDISYGINKNYVDDSLAVEFAIKCLTDGKETDLILELATLYPSDPIGETLNKIVGEETLNFDESISQRKWLYLTLKLIYENKDKYNDPLELIENVYASFDYPESMSSFVRYMPMKGIDLESKEKNLARLFDNWYTYLRQEQKNNKGVSTL